jgi:chromosome segregation ATPase
LQNFSILRTTFAFSPGTIPIVNRKELSEVVAECAARTERAATMQREAIARQDVAIARQEAATAKLTEVEARWEELRQEYARRADEGRERTDAIIAELRDQRDERRALLEALFRVMDRLPPPPPDLRSA